MDLMPTDDALLNTFPATELVRCNTADEAMDQLTALYEDAIALIKEDFEAFQENRLEGPSRPAFYPYLAAIVKPESLSRTSNLAFGNINGPGFHGMQITHPHVFRDYLMDQMSSLIRKHDAVFFVGKSTTRIPLTFALERAASALTPERRVEIKSRFNLPNLIATNDDIVDGKRISGVESVAPLSLFSAERIDYSLHRIRHYTATDPQHFQHFVLFTNYQRYVDEFIEFGRAEVEAGRYQMLIEPGERITRRGKPPSKDVIAKPPQMPAYHLVREGRTGITMVNIGVGPSNAKTVTDHLAVLRSHVWLMVGHCGGLRGSQRLGDYVLAHAYLRDDHVLDGALPTAIPLPTIAEVQVALAAAVSSVTGLNGRLLKERLRTGTVVTTDDRNWELRIDELALRFNQSRAIAIDMESATIAANGYRFRVPYGTLLCVSDRPLHGEVKLPGMADAFYEQSVSQHLQIGIRAMELLRDEAAIGTLHSRKLRSFDEPGFR
ncbi:AMP nucleosidase [Iodidimonas gelatinilytica]|uniref:AMP nucleosidase n=2 Tax=Iodidimonas gelatinilytica TaxID=1236966 RepID=A0A5A7MYN1_9PROT|nr:AMP nucleosidase [Iodidimonas gelatinilytica]GEQ96580.1 AMP nucleosidase [Iodidimonas gelatinilytica]GER00099.1 AMP nucleosidase [Iodidimonas gelatinilytica]